MTMIHMYMVSIICIKNINTYIIHMCLRRIYIYAYPPICTTFWGTKF